MGLLISKNKHKRVVKSKDEKHQQLLQELQQEMNKKHQQEMKNLAVQNENRVNDLKETIKVLFSVIIILSIAVTLTNLSPEVAIVIAVLCMMAWAMMRSKKQY